MTDGHTQGHAVAATGVIKIAEMDDAHLRNTVRFLRAKLSVYALTEAPRGPVGRTLFEARQEDLENALARLSAEAERRGLEIS